MSEPHPIIKTYSGQPHTMGCRKEERNTRAISASNVLIYQYILHLFFMRHSQWLYAVTGSPCTHL